MCYPALLLLCTVMASVTCSADVVSLLARPKPKICIGTSGTLSVPANRTTHFLNLRDRYQDCTYVDGNLELTWLEDESLDLSFLQHIREVTGYVLISYVSVPRLVLPSLQIIRGRTLFQINVRHEEFALMITMSPMTNLEMPALRDILAGSVGIFNNDNLCHIKTINWSEILTGPGAHDVYVYNTTGRQRNCSACHESCPTGAGCWGPGPENCQRLSKINCSPQCHGGRCFGPEPRQCCHLFCAGGCTGPTQSDCLACRNFYDNGVCKQECPSMMQYDQTTYSWKPNPEGKYAYGATCVKQCPAHLLKDNSACVRACPPNKMALKGKCVPCDGPCPKTCKLEGEHPIHSGNIDKLRNCTILQGSLKIQEHSFDGFQEIHSDYTFGPRHVMMPPSRLEVLSSLKEITGFVYIDAYDPQFRDLNFLRNLEVIGGRYRFDVYFALYIVKTSLESLRLHSLREISSGSVKIVENNRLCYAEHIDWHKFVARSKESSGTYHVVVEKNRNATLCSGDGMICDSQCGDDGCWGPGSNSCLSCKNFRAGGNCVQRCDPDLGMYQSSDSTCGACDVQCDGSCTGAGPRRCVRCRNVRDGPVCLEHCPHTKYNSSGRCLPCHANCVDGCTGPENAVGPAACNSCHSALLDHNGHVERCLSANQSCPAGFYREFVGPQLHGPLKALSGKGICRKCHPRCKNCTGYGFHVTVCQECVHYRTGEQCEDSCHGDFYADEVTHQCLPCSSECRGCHGPDNQCSACRNYRIYLDTTDGSSNASAFNCTAQCPSSHPHKVFPEGSEDPFCSSDPSSQHLQSGSSGGETLTIAVASAAALLLLLLVAGVICKCRLDKKKDDMLKMTMMMSKEGLNEPLKVTNVKPNLAKLRIIREVELRKGGILGYGAFGTVYKGVWVPEEEHVKIPVAIKVLREGTGADTNKEILEEAYLMASIEHVNLLPLLAVCMTSQLMLVTQLMPLGCLLEYVRKNRDKIGSKPLLNWGTQIARGMAYLEQHRLVHRDLAARNVLVQNPNLVRITDFGLAKVLDINEDEYKAAGGKMPIKWLALECIQHRIFTHKSDVWAFGVTVWELLTLGGRPYEDVHAKDVPDLLEKGERLPQPSCCSIELYMLMIKCWMLDAESRPAFADLAEEFAKMSRDPGRYLVIQGDKLMRLPSYTQQDERELMRSLAASALDSPADVLMDASEYLNPPGSSAGAVALSGYQRTASTASQHGYGAPSMRLQGDKRRAHSAASSTRGVDHYQSQDLGVLEDDCFEPAVYGGGTIYGRPVPGSSLLLQLPLDDDDYLMPSNGGSAAGYMDLVAERPVHGVLGLDVDNPEYHIMSRRSQQQRPRPSRFSPPIPTPSYGYLDPCGGATSAHVACYGVASPNAVGVPVPPAHAHTSRPSQPNRTLSQEPGRNETTV